VAYNHPNLPSQFLEVRRQGMVNLDPWPTVFQGWNLGVSPVVLLSGLWGSFPYSHGFGQNLFLCSYKTEVSIFWARSTSCQLRAALEIALTITSNVFAFSQIILIINILFRISQADQMLLSIWLVRNRWEDECLLNKLI